MRDLAMMAAVPVLMVLGGCDLLVSGNKAQTKVATKTTKAAPAAGRLCAANATYSRLKAAAFDEAKRIRERDTESLDALADASVVRMENPLLESRDEALGLTVCSGRMVLELPPGAGAAFDGRQRLAADITYSAQAAADGSGTVFKIDGGEPIVYRLAGFDPGRGETRVATANAPAPAPEIIEQAEPETEASIPVPSSDVRSVDSSTVRERRRLAAEQAAAAARRADALADSADAREARAAAAADAREARAARTARTAAIDDAREASAAAAERRARAERIAAARRDERGERELEPRPTRTAARPSFNCRYARSRVEKQICGSSDLAARDRAMANVYYRANDRADGPTRRALSASRLRFLAYRDRCASEACVAGAYEDRMAEIDDIAGR